MKARTMKRHLFDSFKSMKRNGWMTLAAVSAVTVTLLLVGMFLTLLLNMNKLATDIEKDVRVNVYIEKVATDDQKKALKSVLENMDKVDHVELKTSDEELDDLVGSYGSNFSMFQGDENPLYDKYVVSAKEPTDTATVAKEAKELENVTDVSYGKATVDKLFKTLNTVRNIGLGVTIALLLLAMFLISNTIRITILSRSTEIEIMKLVGATNGFIRWPFLLEGAWIGMFGALIPIAILTGVYLPIYSKFHSALTSASFSMLSPSPFLYQIGGVMLAIGMLIGALGSILSMRRFLKN